MSAGSPLSVLAVSTVTLQHGIGGGMEHYFNYVVRGLARKGHEIRVVTTALPKPLDGDANPRFHTLPLDPGSGRRAWKKQLREFYSQSADDTCLILSNSFAAWPLNGVGVPIVCLAHGSGLVDIISHLRLLRRGKGNPISFLRSGFRMLRGDYWHQRGLLKTSDRVAAVSEEVRQALVRFYGISPDKVAVIFSPVDTGLFHPANDLKKVPASPSSPLRLLAAGTINRQKGFDLVVEALALLDRQQPGCYRLKIAGGGPYRKTIQRLARRRRVAPFLEMVGELEASQLAGLFRDSDLFVTATLREEGFPLVIAESLASGVPVIAARSGGTASAVEHGSDGLLVQRGSVGALAEAVQKLAARPDLRLKMSQNARRRAVQDLDWERVVDRLESILRQSQKPR